MSPEMVESIRAAREYLEQPINLMLLESIPNVMKKVERLNEHEQVGDMGSVFSYTRWLYRAARENGFIPVDNPFVSVFPEAPLTAVCFISDLTVALNL
jgi:hypothetical protein